MRPYAFYLSVALLAFGVGSFVVFEFYWKVNEKIEIYQNNEVDESVIASTELQAVESQNNIVAPKGTITCKNKTLILVWNDLEEVAKSTFVDESEASGDCADFFKVEKFYDLNNDGKDEIFIRTQGTPLCGGVGNCDLYVYRRKGNSYESILVAGMAQRFNIKSNKTNGYFDIETSSHGSSMTGGIDVYKFNGKEYEVTKCFDYDYEDKYGKELNEPNLTKRKCWKNGERSY